MADEITVIEQPVSSLFGTEVVPEHIKPTETIINNPLEVVTPANTEATTTTQTEATTTATTETKVPEVDYNTYLKNEFGFDSAEVAKEQIAKWKEMKPYEEPKFANDESRKLYESTLRGDKKEVLQILAKQEAIENLTSIKVDENTPLNTIKDIVKLSMMNDYPTLNKDQIEYRFNKQFSTPSEPKQQIDELDSEFELRKEVWQRQVNDVKNELLIEASISQPKLEKLKTEIQLPDIFKNTNQEVELTQEEIAQNEAIINSTIQVLDNVLKDFKGVEIKVKNGEVELPISYASSETERTQMQTILTEAIRKNDVNGLFGNRWFDKEGKPNTNQMITDLNWMLNGEKIAQKMANESAAQRMEAALKEKANIHLGTQSQGTFQPQKTEQNTVTGSKIPEIMLW